MDHRDVQPPRILEYRGVDRENRVVRKRIPKAIYFTLSAEVLAGILGWIALLSHGLESEESVSLYVGFFCFLLCSNFAVAGAIQCLFLILVRQEYRAGIKSLCLWSFGSLVVLTLFRFPMKIW